jgi:hypothetical protein
MLCRTSGHPDHMTIPQLDLLRDLLRESLQLLPSHGLREVRVFYVRHGHAAMVTGDTVSTDARFSGRCE